MAIPILIVSHRRAGRVTTHKHVAHAKVCIPECQAGEYARHHDPASLVTHPDSVVGLPAKRQWIYEQYGDVFMLDDDSVGLLRIYRPKGSRRHAVCSPQRGYDVIQTAGQTARDLGAFLWGFASHTNPLTFRQLRPFKFGGYSPGGAMGMLRGSKLWFPTDCTLPIDDYWICLLNSHHHRFAYYDGRFAFGFRETAAAAGGAAEQGADDAEAKATAYLKVHFGSAVQPRQVRGKAAYRFERRIQLPYNV